MSKPTKIEYSQTPEFRKDLNRLIKRFRTLEEDLETAKRHAIELLHIYGTDNQSVFAIPDLCSDAVRVYKVKKFACRALKGRGVRSGIRVIYLLQVAEAKVTFVEIYFKGDKEIENRERVIQCLKGLVERT